VIRMIAVLATLLTLTLAGAAAAAGSGVYNGVTSEKGLIHLTVRHNRVVHVRFAVTFFGPDCVFGGASAKTSARIRRDRFRVTVRPGHGKFVVRLTGHFRGRRVTGTLNGTYRGPACNTGKTTYQATR
jgi:hypothetical protein